PLRSALRRADDLLDQPVTVERLREFEEHPDGDRARDGPVPPEAGRALARVLRTDAHQYGGWSPMPMPVAHGSSAWPPAGAYPAPPHSCCWPPRPPPALDFTRRSRSEEHTSELQSRENLVCRLLLEKKKNKIKKRMKITSWNECKTINTKSTPIT